MLLACKLMTWKTRLFSDVIAKSFASPVNVVTEDATNQRSNLDLDNSPSYDSSKKYFTSV